MLAQYLALEISLFLGIKFSSASLKKSALRAYKHTSSDKNGILTMNLMEFKIAVFSTFSQQY